MSRNNSNRISGAGAFELQDWQYGYVQGRLMYRELFLQTFYNKTNEGDSYSLRTGDIALDRSSLFGAQAQHGTTMASGRQQFTYGLDLLMTRPRTEFTIHGRNEAIDDVNEVGAYLQSETAISPRLKAVLAARLDDHSEMKNLNFSPRAALVYSPQSGHTLRATFNRAFAPPTPPQQFVDIAVAPNLAGLPFPIQLRSIPKSGWTMRRDSQGGVGGLYMTSPFTPPSEGGSAQALPAEATRRWDGIVAVMQGAGDDLSSLPPPGPEDVSTDLLVLNLGTFGFDPMPPSEVQSIDRLEPTINNTIEFGYRGVFANRFILQADFYRSENEDFLDPLVVPTPNVFLNAESLEAYLSENMSAEEAAALAPRIAQIPVGTVTPVEGDPADILLTLRNFGDITVYGADVGFTYFPDNSWTVRGSYSYVNEDLFEKSATQPFDLSLNAPRHKLSGSVEYADAEHGWSAEARPRYVDSFPVISAPYQGRVGEYFVLDLLGNYRLPASDTLVSVAVQNVFNNEHEEFIGTPEIGRLAIVRLTQSF